MLKEIWKRKYYKYNWIFKIQQKNTMKNFDNKFKILNMIINTNLKAEQWKCLKLTDWKL